MPYVHKHRRMRVPMGYLGALGALGAWNDETPCAAIPVGDPYRKPGNYCATPDGGYTTFNPDGSVYTTPTTPGGLLDKIGQIITSAFNQRPPTALNVPAPAGMSTTTKLALAGGAILVASMLIRR